MKTKLMSCLFCVGVGLVPSMASSMNEEVHYNLWPIPQSAIEANIGAKLEQNPGY